VLTRREKVFNNLDSVCKTIQNNSCDRIEAQNFIQLQEFT